MAVVVMDRILRASVYVCVGVYVANAFKQTNKIGCRCDCICGCAGVVLALSVEAVKRRNE